MAILTMGRASASTLQVSGERKVRDMLSVFGDDLASVSVIGLSQDRMPGVSGLGQPVQVLNPVLARQIAAGVEPKGEAKGAVFKSIARRAALECTTACLNVKSSASNRGSFGIGAVVYVSAETFASNRAILGNAESGGALQPFRLRLPVIAGAPQPLQWQGITSTWYAGQPNDVGLRGTIATAGWYVVMVDYHNGLSGLQIDERAPLISNVSSNTPTMSSVFFGGESQATAMQGGVLAALICDGPLVQDAARNAQFRAYAAAVLDAARV